MRAATSEEEHRVHQAPHIVNGIAHFDVTGPQPERLHSFYATVFGWQVDAQGPGYALLRTPPGSADGAVVEAHEPSLTVGVAVPDLDAAVRAAVASGGAVTMPATDNGWVVVDPAGNRVTLIQG
jgi:predicted enzyme related to lactoylglutathione lyase